MIVEDADRLLRDSEPGCTPWVPHGEMEASGSALPEVPLPPCCPGCGIVLKPAGLAMSVHVCDCGHHFAIHGEAWVQLFADAGSWREHWAHLWPRDVAEWERPRPYGQVLSEAADRGLNESVRVGTCEVGGRRIWLAVFDFRFIGGTLGVVAGERLARAAEHAARAHLPLVLLCASGGARMQEGPLALMQMAKINAAIAALHEAGVLFLSVLTYPTYGGLAASMALVADVNIAEAGAAIGFTGPRVIQQATHETLPPGFQTAEYQLRHGQVDIVVPRTELRSTVAALHDLFSWSSRG